MLDQLAADLRRDEDEKLTLYRCPAGKLTIGVGRNLEDRGITAEESALMLRTDIGIVIAELDREMPWWRGLTENRQRALANMAFNLGMPRLKGFRNMLSFLEAGVYDRAAEEALDSQWARQVGARAQRIAKLIREG